MTRAKIDHDVNQVELRLIERMDGIRATLQARLDAIDKAAALFDVNLNRIPTTVDREVAALESLTASRMQDLTHTIHATRCLTEEKFNGVDRQFVERDVRVLQSAAAATTAVNAALQAAKEAVGEQNKSFTLSIDKSETATMKQIDALLVTSQTATAGLNSAISDVKDRLTRIEGAKIGVTDTTTNQHLSSSMTMSIIAAVISAVVAFAYVASLFHSTVGGR